MAHSLPFPFENSGCSALSTGANFTRSHRWTAQLCSEKDYQFYTWWLLVGRCDVQFTYRVCLHSLILMTGVPRLRYESGM